MCPVTQCSCLLLHCVHENYVRLHGFTIKHNYNTGTCYAMSMCSYIIRNLRCQLNMGLHCSEIIASI